MYIDQFNIDPHHCVIEDTFDINRVRHNESVMALGTGYMTTRASFDEGFTDDEQNISYDRMAMNVSLEVTPCKKSRWGTFIQRVQGKHPFWNVGIVNLPYYLGLEVHADGERLDMEHSRIIGYKRWLDLKNATLYRSFIWETADGRPLNLLFTRFMDPDDKFLCVQQLKITSLSGTDTRIDVMSYVDNDVRTNGFDKFVSRSVAAEETGGGHCIYSDVTANLGDRIVTLSRTNCDRAYTSFVATDERRVTATLSMILGAGEETTLLKVSAQMADIYFEREALLDAGKDMINAAIDSGFDALHGKHTAHWREKWAMSDIIIEADDEPPYNSQLAIRQAIYHLLRARSTDPHALNCAKGTTSEMYLGSVCWDMEIFFQPFYIYTQPALAKMTHLYRYHMLDGARRSAQAMHYKGARYPWQTDRHGDEVCPLFEYADHEIHISADICLGLWHYYLNTLDTDYLFNQGLEIIIETARYWATRVNRLPGRPGFHILGVMGPDEYKPITNNNAYTNFVVRENLRLVGTVVGMCKDEAPETYRRLREKLAFDESEIALYDDIADNLSIPKDEARHIVWQCDDFDTAYAEIDIEGLWTDKSKLFGFHTTQELRYRSKCLKQSDVIALMGLYTEAFTKAEMAASYDYYTPFTIHDSSNSICHNTIVAAAIGRKDVAYANWLASLDIDFGTMPRAAEGIHFANVGGMWQEIVFGFGGMVSALNSDVLTFKPCMPQQFRVIAFQLIWKGQHVAVRVEPGSVCVKNLSDKELCFTVHGYPAQAGAGGEEIVNY